jgi:undecaprenyl pyrophosphate phosphatase UppP
MNRITGAIKATYTFFAGDMIILIAVIVAFILGALLYNVAHTPNPVTAAVFVAFIVGGLTVTLRRERGDRPRLR